MTRAVLLGVAALVLAWAWFGDAPPRLEGSFSAHMTRHMGVVAIAAPLLALGISGTALDPVLRRPAIFAPIPASLVELVAVWVWHAPALHELARESTFALALEQGSFLASGCFVWMSACGGAEGERNRGALGVVALLLTSMHMTLLGALLALSPRALYSPATCAAATTLADQHLGGAIMLLVGGVSYLVGGLALTSGILGRDR
jgi:putative membrane protein